MELLKCLVCKEGVDAITPDLAVEVKRLARQTIAYVVCESCLNYLLDSNIQLTRIQKKMKRLA